MLSKVLIANRGEIAVRVIRAARRLGIGTVAVYSEADAGSLHVAMADSAYCVGPPPARESYLNVDAIVAAIKDSGADAVHPGYGFLSENADFAEACAAAGAVFIGPPVEAIRAMGSKSGAKAIMAKADVPMLPGYHGKRQDMKTLARAAERVGYPVMVKASAGGGGMGMRIVEDADSLEDAVTGAKRQAKAAFGDDRMLIEKYLGRPRHVEIQVFADSHGNAVHLFERDCSIQRRHQKVVEEAPAPGMTAALRRRMGEAAVAAAAADRESGSRRAPKSTGLSAPASSMDSARIAFVSDESTAGWRPRSARRSKPMAAPPPEGETRPMPSPWGAGQRRIASAASTRPSGSSRRRTPSSRHAASSTM